MKKIIISILLLLSDNSYAQIFWVRDFERASQMAIAENKFIVMDFWATWCGPCVAMDREMWSSTKINDVANNFVALKIDVDQNRSLAVKYSATSIPKVVLIDPAGNVIWQQVGYSSPSPYLKMFDQIPASILEDKALKKEVSKDGNDESWNSLALSYQQMGKDINSTRLSSGFFKLSDNYFHKVEKAAKEKEVSLYARLNMILNDAYQGKTKSALKQISKVDDDSDFKNYILAYCYKCTGQTDEMEKYKKLITSEELLAQLEL